MKALCSKCHSSNVEVTFNGDGLPVCEKCGAVSK